MIDLPRRTVAEALGTAILLATVIGSGIMGERLASGNVAIALVHGLDFIRQSVGAIGARDQRHFCRDSSG